MEIIRQLEVKKSSLIKEIEDSKASQEDLEQRIIPLYKQIGDFEQKMIKLEKEKEVQLHIIQDLQKEFKQWQEEKEDIENKVELIERDRLVLKNELQDLRVFEFDLYNKVVDKDNLIDKLNKQIDQLSESFIKMEKNNEKLLRKLDSSEKNQIMQQKQYSEKIESLNQTILNDRKDLNDVSKVNELKQKEISELKNEINDLKIKIDSFTSDVEKLQTDLLSKIEINTNQIKEIELLNSKVKSIKTKKQHLERTIQQLKEFKESVDEITEQKIAALTDEVKYLKSFNDKEKDLFFMIYEDLRSQWYEYKYLIDKHRETIRQQNETIYYLTKDKNEGLEKIAKLNKRLEKTRLELENVKSENLHLVIKVKDNDELIIYLKKHLELKSMGFEEYFQKYVKLYKDHHHLQNKHTVLSNRFAQYELIVKTSKSMLEALRNRKNAKVQTELFKNHDIAIMTDLVWKEISHSGIVPSLSSNRSELSLYPAYRKKNLEEKNKGFKPSKSFNKEISDDSDKLINLDDSTDKFRLPIGSQKTVGIFRESKIKFSFMESQISSIKKVVSRYDSKKSSDSAEELGVDLFETINQIESAHKNKESSSYKTKDKNAAKRSRRRAKSIEISPEKVKSELQQIEKNPSNRTSGSLKDLHISKRMPLMRRKFQRK